MRLFVLTSWAFCVCLFHVSLYGQTYVLQSCQVTVNASFRGVSAVDDSVVWVSGSNGWIGHSTDGARQWQFRQVTGFEKLDFRSVHAFNSKVAIIANAGSPAYVLKTIDAGNTWQVVYQNDHHDAFIDGVGFWNDQVGMVYGDPLQGRMLLAETKDGGNTWKELPEIQRPLLLEGEASFAASGTGLRCYHPSKVVLATGGKSSRLFISTKLGRSWKICTPPILQGQNSTGIFSVAFQGRKGIVVGGDYLRDSLKVRHVFLTRNAGKTWQAPDTPTRGYRECVEYVTDKVVIATGPSGTDISFNEGLDWQMFSDEKDFHVVRKARNGKLIVIAGGGKISQIIIAD